MHGIVVIPLSAPDEAMFFKDFDDVYGYLVVVSIGSFVPSPVGRVFDIDIDGCTKRVDGEATGACDLSPFEGTTHGDKELLIAWMLFE